MAVEGDPIVRSMRERFQRQDTAVPVIEAYYLQATELIDQGDIGGALELELSGGRGTFMRSEAFAMVAHRLLNEGRYRELEEFGNLGAESILSPESKGDSDDASRIYVMMGRAKLAQWEDPRGYFDKAIKATENWGGESFRVDRILKIAGIMARNNQDPKPYVDIATEIADSIDLSGKDVDHLLGDGMLDSIHRQSSLESIAEFQIAHGLLDDAERTLQKYKEFEELVYDSSEDAAKLIKILEEARKLK